MKFIFLGATLIILSSIYIDEKYYFLVNLHYSLIGTFLIIYSKEANYFGYILRNKIINFWRYKLLIIFISLACLYFLNIINFLI